MQKARGHTRGVLPLLVGIRFQVLLHSPNRGSFHLSLTVLCAIGQQEYLALRDMVHADSHRISRARCYSGLTKTLCWSSVYRTLTFFGWPSHAILLPLQITSDTSQFSSLLSLYPMQATAASLTLTWFRLFPVRSPLLRESFLLSFPPIT